MYQFGNNESKLLCTCDVPKYETIPETFAPGRRSNGLSAIIAKPQRKQMYTSAIDTSK